MSRTTDERKEALRRRTETAIHNRGKKGLGRSSVIDISKISLPEYTLKAGREDADINAIDLLPFLITQEWYAALRTYNGNPTGLEVGSIDYKLEIPVHSNVGPENKIFLCLRLAFGKPCAVCKDLISEYEKEKKDRNKDLIRSLTPSWRVFYNLYDYEEPEPNNAQKVLLNCAYKNFEEELLESSAAAGEQAGGAFSFSDPEEGKILVFRCKEKTMGDNPYSVAETISFEDRKEPYDLDQIVKETISFDALLHIPKPEEVENAYLGIDSDASAEEKADTEKQPAREETQRTRTRTRQATRNEETIGEEEEEGTCPYGHDFGNDFNEFDDCQNEKGKCLPDIFEACGIEQERLTSMAKDSPLHEEETVTMTVRTRGKPAQNQEETQQKGRTRTRGKR